MNSNVQISDRHESANKVDTGIKTTITVSYGDGIGPEIMKAALSVLKAAGAVLDIEEIEVGERVYKAGVSTGISGQAWESIRKNKVFFKGPITTPQGGGYKSLNVTLRKTLGLYANVRPCQSFYPFVDTRHPDMDVVIIRENEEDLYAGIEHQQTQEVVQCLKLISRPGCERIIRYAFEYARSQGRKKVTCLSKDNIMKQTDGLFHKVFREIAAEYPELKSEHLIVDIGTALIADSPERFDVVVVGSGPAGASAARTLARAGARPRPRRPCGPARPRGRARSRAPRRTRPPATPARRGAPPGRAPRRRAAEH